MDLKQIRDAAAGLAAGDAPEVGWLRWLEARLGSETSAPWRPMPAWWVQTYERFWRSGKLELVGSVGRRGTKSSSCCRVAVCEVLFRPRRVEPGTELAWPILSCDMAEANGRQRTLKAILEAIGLTAVADEPKAKPGTFWASSPNQGRSKVVLYDADEHRVEFRIAPASPAGVSGFTGLGGLGDEMELGVWAQTQDTRKDVLDMWRPTLKGQPGARLYLYSAPYGERGPHTKMVLGGSTDERHVATLGDLGARLDTTARRALAPIFADKAADRTRPQRERDRFARYAADPRLLCEGDPASTSIPSWVANPTNAAGDGPDPVGAILECYRLAAVDVEEDGGDTLLQLFARYGAVPMAAGASRLFDAVTLDDAGAMCVGWP